MLRKLVVYIFLSSLLFSHTFSQSLQDNKRVLCFLLSDAELPNTSKAGPSFITLTFALFQKACPIVISSSLMRVMEYAHVQLEKLKIANYQLKMLHEKAFFLQSDPFDQMVYYLNAASFNPKEWIIKKVDNALYLLIPENYLQKLSINRNDIEKQAEDTKATDTELLLGLKVNHMPTIAIGTIGGIPTQLGDNFLNLLYNEQTKTSSLFCLHDQYLHRSQPRPVWSFCMSGHGLPEKMILDLSLPAFKKLLAFMSKKIKSYLLIYDSCYSAGINTEIIYKDAESPIQRTYPFAIVTRALTDAEVMSGTFKLTLSDQKGYVFSGFNSSYVYNIVDFVKELESSDTTPQKAARALYGIFFHEEYLASTPQIKLPGIEWFSILEDNKKIFYLTNNLTRARTKPLNIKTFTKNDPKVVLLYSKVIPFELILNPGISAIVSMVPGTTGHYIEKISSPFDFAKTIALLKKIDTRVAKTYYIKEFSYIDTIRKKRESITHLKLHNSLSGQPSTRKWEYNGILNGRLLEQYDYSWNTAEKYIKDWDSGAKIIYSGFKPSELTTFDFLARQSKASLNYQANELLQLKNELSNLLQISKDLQMATATCSLS